MRLLHAKEFTFKEFIGRNIPKYAIISHRWSEQEVTYQDFLEGRDNFLQRHRTGYGWTKIRKAGKLTLKYGLEWFWIDTCCIDKNSSAELSEAINSMYKWYQKSAVCWVFLPDVQTVDSQTPGVDLASPAFHRSSEWNVYFNIEQFKASVWFTRAWTLQELLAPRVVVLFDSTFRKLGYHTDTILFDSIIDVTGVDRKYLIRGAEWRSIQTASVAERMKWASYREATREEDIAYSLMGIFQVNMPLLYGEGNRAFSRLQSEILRTTNDESIFAWSFEPPIQRTGLLSHKISQFCRQVTIHRGESVGRRHYEETNQGLRLTLSVPAQFTSSLDKRGESSLLIPINCFLYDTLSRKTVGGIAIRVDVVRKSLLDASGLTLLYGRRASGILFIYSPLPDLESYTPLRGFVKLHSTMLRDEIVAGWGKGQTEVSIYFPDTIELDARSPESLDYEALSEEWGKRTVFFKGSGRLP